jgi:L-ribulokinase
VINHAELAEVPGMCGVVDGGITPGLWGYVAGQSGVGDIFGWFAEHIAGRSHEELSREAAAQQVGEHGLVALDWHSGNRSVLVDHELSGLIVGLTLATRPPDVYRALVEATAFGARTIVEAFESAGLPVRDFVVAGGLLKNPFVLQIYADVLRRPLHLIGSEQGPALGSAIHAAVAARVHPDIQSASEAMGRLQRDAYEPDHAAADAYDALYAHYVRLHDHFGRGADDVMHRLRHRAPAPELVRD